MTLNPALQMGECPSDFRFPVRSLSTHIVLWHPSAVSRDVR
ncbi:MAG: hypothetical protein ACTSUE_24515 [Promethearchaeota archaeon]